jgi:hypothetical protein
MTTAERDATGPNVTGPDATGGDALRAGSPARARMVGYLRSRASQLEPAGIEARLRAAAAEVDQALAGLAEVDARRAPAPGAWSIARVVDHLAQTMIRSAEELSHLRAGRRPPGPPVYDALTSAGAEWAPWAELLEGLRSANAEFVRVFAGAGVAPPPAGTIRTVLVVNVDGPDGSSPDVFTAELDWKEYALVQRLHLLDHRAQVRKLRGALGC